MLVNLGLVIGAVLVALVGIEALLRFGPLREMVRGEAAHYVDIHGSIYDYGVGKINIRLKPLAVSTVVTSEFRVQYFINSLGYREREFTVEKPPGTYRIVVIGDSMTFGVGVELEETFVKRVERRFQAHPPLPGTRIQVLNLGCGSYSAGQNFVLLRDQALRLQPDLVLLVHFSNDAMEWPFRARGDGLPDTYVVSSEYWKSLRMDGKRNVGAGAEPAFVPPYWLTRLAMRSKLAELALRGLESWRLSQAGSVSYDQGDVHNDPFWPLRPGADFSVKEWELSERIHVAARRLAEDAGAEFLLAFVPSGDQVNGFEWDRGRTRHGFSVGKVSSANMQDRIGRAVSRSGGKILDLTEEFRRRSSVDERLYFRYNGHLTRFGHAVVAARLEGALHPLIAGRN